MVLRLAGARLLVWAIFTDEMAKVTSSARASKEKECVSVVVVMDKEDLMIKTLGIFRPKKDSRLLPLPIIHIMSPDSGQRNWFIIRM